MCVGQSIGDIETKGYEMYKVFVVVLAVLALGQAEQTPQNARLSNYCPSVDGYWTTFIRDIYSCAKYYKCSNGNRIPQHCPPGLFFNPKKLICDYPERAGCHVIVKRSLTEDGPHLAKVCPKEDGVWPTYLINPKDCSSFYECSHGKPFLKHCQKGTEFDAKRLVCDRPEQANCHVKAEDLFETSFAVAEDEDAEYQDGPHLGKWCPRVDGRWPTYLVDRYNCHRYYECSNGRPLLHRCPGALVFNPKKLTCDRWENVKCRPWLP